jgi:hypothetical protein
MIRPCPLPSDLQGGSIVVSPKDAAKIRLALMMALERANDLELEAMVRAAYQLLHTGPKAAASAKGARSHG